MKRGFKLGITLCAILISLPYGCATPSKEKSNIRGIIPYIVTDFDKKYAPKAEDYGEGNIIRYEFK